ncbi:tight adherence protein B [Clavibacter michiganensis]|uniref:type II secretion system F family protein n=1 Tax=Clavibacter michiganensis TaxID=28447 RepID=UPI00195DDB52|nr:type II secretion system F family protein [Clavibacter michiganensis]MBM7413174.1 tight adherence protein B [Clavibacter michiganensis]
MIRRSHPVPLRRRLRGAGDEAVVEEAEEIAGFVRRLAVLLGAGLHPERAWSQLAPPGGRARRGERAVPAMVRRVAAGAGSDPLAARVVEAATAVERAGGATARSWCALAAGLEVADRTGAPLARSLHRLADSLVDIARVRRDAGTALAGPVATSRTVLLMPGAGLLLAAGLGFDPLRVLVTTVPGLACLVVGSSLVAIGWRWNRGLVSRAVSREPAPGLVLDLVAMAMSGGASVPRAVAVVRRACERAGLGTGDDLAAVGSVVDAAARTGAPVAALLGSEAERIRRDAATRAERAAARLAARLMLPLGVCILPAFLAVGVVPMLLAVVSSTLGHG